MRNSAFPVSLSWLQRWLKNLSKMVYLLIVNFWANIAQCMGALRPLGLSDLMGLLKSVLQDLIIKFAWTHEISTFAKTCKLIKRQNHPSALFTSSLPSTLICFETYTIYVGDRQRAPRLATAPWWEMRSSVNLDDNTILMTFNLSLTRRWAKLHLIWLLGGRSTVGEVGGSSVCWCGAMAEGHSCRGLLLLPSEVGGKVISNWCLCAGYPLWPHHSGGEPWLWDHTTQAVWDPANSEHRATQENKSFKMTD